ncbi:MAG: hypothetical protein L0215_01390 [Gemmataceae bacterium]|nr:hypothetical protein [Gemmataceae bacterium]
MKRRQIALTGLLLFFVAIAWAGSGGPVGSLTWTSGYPKEGGTGTVTGSGAFSYSSGWSNVSGTMEALLAADGSSEEFHVYTAPMLIATLESGEIGTWTATTDVIPAGTYKVLAWTDVTDGKGSAEIVVAEFKSATVGGTKKKVDPGEVKITTIDGKNKTIEASGTFKSYAGWSTQVNSLKALAMPTNFLGVIDGTRKAVPGKVVPNAPKGEWTVKIQNLQPGWYDLYIRTDFVDMFDPKNIEKKAAWKRIQVKE